MNAPAHTDDFRRFDYARYESLVNEHRDFQAAFDMAWRHHEALRKHGITTDKQTYKRLIFCSLMNGVRLEDTELQNWLSSAQKCADWDDIDLGDIYRDVAIQHIREGRLDEGERLLDETFRIHDDDSNRIACAMGVRGRLHLKRGDSDDALLCFTTAESIWHHGSGGCAEQWRTNMRHHELIAMTLAGRHASRRAVDALAEALDYKSGFVYDNNGGIWVKHPRYPIYKGLLAHEPNWVKRIIATLIMFGGKPVARYVLARS